MLEGIAYNVKYNIEQFPYLLKQINIFGGGANSREIIQIFADVIGQEVYYNEKASTALGIAFLAGYGSKEIEQYSILPEVWFGDSQRIAPNAENVEKYKRLYVQYEELRADLLSMDKKYAKRRS
jgi:xylulokinase